MNQLSFEKIENVLFEVLSRYNFPEQRARHIAHTFTQSSCDGVHSHGLNRFPLFINYVERELINIRADAEKMASFGNLERWEGNLAPGITNAHQCMNRAVELADNNTLGCVALRNTNHWMRGGTYGWQAADEGKIGLCFTNTQPNMPAWGGKENCIGNNPFVIAIPREEGHVVLDMATSQFSLGTINSYKQNGEKLPFPGGWDNEGKLTHDPEEILDTGKALPVGYWKGSALTVVLDMLAALLSNGNPTCEIEGDGKEIGISQVFICIDPENFGDNDLKDNLLNEIVDDLHNSTHNEGNNTYYPGEQTLSRRKKNLENGIPVNESVWETILDLR